MPTTGRFTGSARMIGMMSYTLLSKNVLRKLKPLTCLFKKHVRKFPKPCVVF
jgi:hypothetical protein